MRLPGQDSILGIEGWRWVFLVNVPVGAAALAVVSKTLHLHHTRLDHRIDWLGAALLSTALVPLLLVAEQGREWGWSAVSSTTCYVVGVLGAIGFFWQEWRMKEEAILPLAMFRNRTVGVSSVASVLIGVAMSRTGRYRMFPIIGSGLLAVSLFVFHYVEFDTPLQPLTLAVQNAVPPQQIGVATSTATFTRQIVGALGTAVFLSILFSTAGVKIEAALRVAVPTPDFQAALADPANAAVAGRFQDGQAREAAGAVLQDSSFLNDLDERLARPFLIGFSEAMDLVFLVGAGVMVVGFLVMPLLPHVELRKSATYGQRARDESAAAAAH